MGRRRRQGSLHRRLQGHQCRCDHRSRCRHPPAFGPDRWRRRQGAGLRAACARVSRQGSPRGTDWQGRASNWRRTGGCLPRRIRGHDARRRRSCRRRGAARRCRIALASMREPRYVSRLQSSRRRLRRGSARARRQPGMSTATLSQGLRARERMPFTWDYLTIGLVAALLLVGLVMVTSASMSIAARDLGSPFFYLQRQFVYGGLGVLIAWVATRIPTQLWEKYSTPLLFVGLVLLLLVLVPGIGAVVNGARRWLRVGTVNFQVSELARVLFLTWVCAYCVRKRAVLEKTWGGLLTPVAPLGLAGILLLVEPDFGATTVLVATGCAILFIGGARLRYVIALV